MYVYYGLFTNIQSILRAIIRFWNSFFGWKALILNSKSLDIFVFCWKTYFSKKYQGHNFKVEGYVLVSDPYLYGKNPFNKK